jgi:plastocyanin
MKKAGTPLAIVAALAASLALTGCNSSSNPYGSNGGNNTSSGNNSAPNTVVIYNYAFGTPTLAVARGTTVTWQNTDVVAHTATSDAGTWDTGSIAPGASKSITFSTAGTFPYHCIVHPMMTGVIVVQ